MYLYLIFLPLLCCAFGGYIYSSETQLVFPSKIYVLSAYGVPRIVIVPYANMICPSPAYVVEFVLTHRHLKS